MPDYVYTDGVHTLDVTHRMLYSTAIVCTTCDAEMWRIPQPVNVTWGGLKPSGGELAPDVQQLINSAPQERDKFAEVHEKHERDTEN